MKPSRTSLQAYLDKTLSHKRYAIPTGSQGAYITSDFLQDSHDAILKDIQAHTVPPEARHHTHVYVGIGGYFNLDAMLAAQADAAVLVDVSETHKFLWHDTFEAMAASPDCASFKEAMRKKCSFLLPTREYNPHWVKEFDRPSDHGLRLFKDIGIDEEEGYQKIRQMVLDGRIAYVPMNAFNTRTCAALRQRVEAWTSPSALPPKITTVYGSNVWDTCGHKLDDDKTGMLLNFVLYRMQHEGKGLDQAITDMLDERFAKHSLPPETREKVVAALTSVLADPSGHPAVKDHWEWEGSIRGSTVLQKFNEQLACAMMPEDIEKLFLRTNAFPYFDRHPMKLSLEGLRTMGSEDTTLYLATRSKGMMKIHGGRDVERFKARSKHQPETVIGM